jgi:hypothetical protein
MPYFWDNHPSYSNATKVLMVGFIVIVACVIDTFNIIVLKIRLHFNVRFQSANGSGTLKKTQMG